MTDLPERPRAHEVADAAVNEFRHHAPSSWSANELSRDYGRDLLVSIPTPDGRMAGNDFWVQVKGSESVKYLEDRAHLSFDLEVRTINHLLSVGGPSMLAVCDVAKSDKPVFWAWIEEGIEAAHPKWREQKTLNIRVPLIQELSKTSKKIEDHVSAWHSNRQISGRISQFVSAAIGSKPDTNIPPEAYLREVAIPKLQTLGILETTATGETVSYTPDQVKLKRDLAEIGALLKVYDDRAASTALDDIVSRAEAEGVPARLQSVYFNHRGVLASRSGKIALSVEWHRRAVDHNPDEIIFLTNLLMSELALSDESDNAVILPQDWDARLACILQSRPDFIPAIKIMVRRLAETEGLERAKQYVGEFDKKELIIEANLSLAEACLFGGSPGSALDAVEKAETNGAKLDSFFHSLKAHILFIQSTKASGDLREVVLQGTGPADLDTTALIRSGEHYEKACALIVREGFPTNAAEQVVANAATAMILLGTPQRAIELCQGQIALNPASLLINSALAAAYAQANEPSKAVLHTRRGPDTSHTFQNLILLLAATDRLDELIEETSNRETLGFRNDDERGLCYELAAIALWERGKIESSEKCLAQLRQDPKFAGRAIVAELEIARREGKSPNERISMVRKGLADQTDDPSLLMLLVRELAPPGKENAEELIACIEKLAKNRQLTQQEFYVLGHAYRLFEKLTESENVFRSATKRYPTELRLLFDYAYVLTLQGKYDEAYGELRHYIDAVGRNQLAYRNLGILASRLGEIDEAIDMFRRALVRAEEVQEKAELNCILWELCRGRGDSSNSVLRYVVAYGDLIDRNDVDAEARFLMMVFMTTGIDENDQWVKDAGVAIRERLSAFSKAHADHPGLRSFSLPAEVSNEEQAHALMVELAALTQQGRLVRETFEIASRGGPWPLTVRSQFLGGGRSIFQYWQECAKAREYGSAIHIAYPPLSEEREASRIDFTMPVCIDMTALLTLHGLNLLDEFAELFPEIVLASGTRMAIQRDQLFSGTDPIAARMRDWLQQHRAKIRTRATKHEEQEPVENVLSSGVGESFVVARDGGLQLYSDEGVVRVEAESKGCPSSFSTLSLLRCLRNRNRLSLVNDSRLRSRLIALNYRHVSFKAEHIYVRLDELASTKPPIPLNKSEALYGDEVLGPLLIEFGESKVDKHSLVIVLTELTKMLLSNDRVPDDATVAILNSTCFALEQRPIGQAVQLAKSDRNGLAILLWSSILLLGTRYTSRAWSLIKSCAESRAKDEAEYERLIFERVPDALFGLASSSTGNSRERDALLAEITSCLPERGRSRFQERLFAKGRLHS